MKLISYLNFNGEERLGLYHEGKIADLHNKARTIGINLPRTMDEFLAGGTKNLELASKVDKIFKSGDVTNVHEVKGVELLAPLPHPGSLRIINDNGINPENDKPAFCFANHHALIPGGNILLDEKHFDRLGFNLRFAFVIYKRGRNIKTGSSIDYIAGLMLITEFISKDYQEITANEKSINAKCNDFAFVCSPWLLTPGASEEKFDLDTKLVIRKNNQVMKELTEYPDLTELSLMIETASCGTELIPGDILATKALYSESEYLNKGDELVIESETFGTTFCKLST